MIILLAGCSSDIDKTNRISHLSTDVTIHQLAAQESHSFRQKQSLDRTAENCDEKLEKIICVSDNSELGYDSNCSFDQVESQIIQKLKELIVELPSVHRKMFCDLDRLQLHKNIYSIGYASQIRDSEGLPIGSLFGIRPDLLTNKNNNYFTWKEQLNFGLSDPSGSTAQYTPTAPQVEIVANSINPVALYVVTHELSHLLDMLNDANIIDFSSCTKSPFHSYWQICTVPSHAFNYISWGPSATVLMGNEDTDWDSVEWPPVNEFWYSSFPNLSKLCFYWCEGRTLPTSQINAVYRELQESEFVTTYSTSSFMEDFAESATLWALAGVGRRSAQVVKDESGRVLYDSREQMKKPALKPKLEWLQEFFSRQNLRTRYTD